MILTSSLTDPSVPCCDICHPELLNRTRPARSETVKRKPQVKFGLANSDVEDALHEWRKRVWAQDFKNAMFGPTGILTNETVALLASVGPILSLKQLETIVGENWPWFGKYGDNLLTELISLNIPPMIPKPPQPRRTKRAATNETVTNVGGGKRHRTLPDNQASTTPTPVKFVNAPGPSSTLSTLPSHPFYPYPSTPVRPLGPPFPPTTIYQNPYHGYMIPATPLYHAFPQTNTPTPLATPSSSSRVTPTTQPTSSLEFRHYIPGSKGTSNYTNPP